MVVSESALRKMMDKAYKGGGYHVATGNTPFGDCLMIANYGYAWCAVIKFVHVPWPVLGRIVSDIGEIPEDPGTAYLVNKDNVQTEEYDVAAKPILGMLARTNSVAPALKRTTLVFDGRNVWQRSDSMEIVMLNPDYEELAVLKDAQPFMVEDCLCARGQHSQIFIGRIRPGDHEKDRVRHLSQILWT